MALSLSFSHVVGNSSELHIISQRILTQFLAHSLQSTQPVNNAPE